MKKKIKQALISRIKHSITNTRRIPSAVLLPLFIKSGQCHILFTRRSRRVRYHKGEISFPGGAYEPQDKKLVNTALRETCEEIGIRQEDVEILGELDDFATAGTNYLITPFVGIIPYPYAFKLSPAETDEILEIPVSELFRRDNESGFKLISMSYGNSYIYRFEGYDIHGATARILHQFLQILKSINYSFQDAV